MGGCNLIATENSRHGRYGLSYMQKAVELALLRAFFIGSYVEFCGVYSGTRCRDGWKVL